MAGLGYTTHNDLLGSYVVLAWPRRLVCAQACRISDASPVVVRAKKWVS